MTTTATPAPGPSAAVEPDRGDRRLALGATGLLRAFNEADVLTAADVQVASRLGAVLGEQDATALLGAAMAVRAVRHGSICVDLSSVAEQAVSETELAWPEPAAWRQAVADSAFVREEVLRLEGDLLYLDRYWREERQVCDDLVGRIQQPPPAVDEEVLADGLGRVFPDVPDRDYGEQRTAVEAAARRWTSVLTGGPGTGKTTTVAGLLAVVAEQHQRRHGQQPRIALCAPTGKAAARLQEAVDAAVGELRDPDDRTRLAGLTATTMHRLLGWRRDSSVRFRHHRGHRLPHDVVVVDESSMVSLTMMARLLEAVRPDARLVLVGDPHQLSSVEAGAVLADLVEGFTGSPVSPVVSLRRTHRFGAEIGSLAEALRVGDATTVLELLRGGGPEAPVQRIDPDDEATVAALHDDLGRRGARLCAAAEDLAASPATAPDEVVRLLRSHRLLCAHREGPYGVGGWNRLVERLIAERTGVPLYDEWYPGRPVLVTANDRGQRLSNGDTGVAVRTGEGTLRVLLDEQERRLIAPGRLPEVQTMHAMTVHKAQGSQADVVSVVMPPPDSRLLTRELFYTAVTRAEQRVRVIGSEEAVTAAVERQVPRASGLRRRLREALARSSQTSGG